MKAYIQVTMCANSPWAWRVAIAFLALALPFPAFGALGASLESVQSDQIELQAKVTISIVGTYTICEMSAPSGTVVREYVSQTGKVFGVTWQGPFIPDMRQLLGRYFDQYSQAAKDQRKHHVGRVPLDIHEPGLIVQTAGHMLAHSGRAYDPGLLPVGVSDHDIR
ncbi:MAG: DUF2844 domain-containing protein [Candidatus Sulfotelmatobacter sp.]